ncbi:MAG: hypothetical protein ACW99F_03330 [Candidatus Hodarchaeales archaeon]
MIFFVSTYSFDPSGTFVIENTSDLHNLCGIYGSYPFVGETWNLTVVVDMNSSSGVTIFSSTYVSSYQKHWEGALEFSVFPNHSQTQTYISHLQIDTTAFPLFDIALINSSGCANGSYKLEKIFNGYHVDDLVTGHTYISNLTAWLEELSITTSSTSDTIDFVIPPNLVFGGLILGLIFFGFYFRFRKGRKV